jgi:hypothetical protein
MNDTSPKPITNEEWREIMDVQEVREAWGIEKDETPEEFASVVYGAKFAFHSGGPGYVGDLYILQGDALTGDGPMLLKRNSEKKLEVFLARSYYSI